MKVIVGILDRILSAFGWNRNHSLFSRTFTPADHPLRSVLDVRYAALRIAMSRGDRSAIASLLTPDFASIDVRGKLTSGDEMIDSVRALDIDRSKRTAVTTLTNIEERDGVALVLQHYNMESAPDAPRSMPRRLQTLSRDTWQLIEGSWLMRRTETLEVEVVTSTGLHKFQRADLKRRQVGVPQRQASTTIEKPRIASAPVVEMREWSEDELRSAIVALRTHLEANPRDFPEWFDLGLACKFLRDWSGCIAANRAILDDKHEAGNPAWWNLGIAATAMRDWPLARSAWRGYGLDIPDGDGPITVDYGSAAIRLGDGEVVWGDRFDPARVVIRNVPFPESGHRWGDVVLHDGAPNGERRIGEREYPVFDELERLTPSEIPTVEVTVRCERDEDSVALVDTFAAAGFVAEDWTSSVRPLCNACSESRPDYHSHPIATTSEERHFGLAAPMGFATQLLDQWQSESPGTRAHGVPEQRG